MTKIILPRGLQGRRNANKEFEINQGDLVLVVTIATKNDEQGYHLGAFEKFESNPEWHQHTERHGMLYFYTPCWKLRAINFGGVKLPGIFYSQGLFSTRGIEEIFIEKANVIKALEERNNFRYFVPFIRRMKKPYR